MTIGIILHGELQCSWQTSLKKQTLRKKTQNDDCHLVYRKIRSGFRSHVYSNCFSLSCAEPFPRICIATTKHFALSEPQNIAHAVF